MQIIPITKDCIKIQIDSEYDSKIFMLVAICGCDDFDDLSLYIYDTYKTQTHYSYDKRKQMFIRKYSDVTNMEEEITDCEMYDFIDNTYQDIQFILYSTMKLNIFKVILDTLSTVLEYDFKTNECTIY